jgi:hypothetical protein
MASLNDWRLNTNPSSPLTFQKDKRLMNIINFLQFVFINAVTLLLALGIYSKIEKKKTLPLLDFITRLSVIFFSLILGLQIILGIFGQLNKNSLLVTLAILLIGLLFSPQRKKLLPNISCNLKELSPWMLLGLPILLITFIRLSNALLQVPLEYDNLAYHLPFTSEWLQSGSILTPYYSAFASPISHYPSNFELLDLWLMLPFHSDLLINLINFPILILFGLTLYKICRNFNLNKAVSTLATLIPLYMPVFLRQIGTPLVDLFFSLCFLYCIYFLQGLSKDRENKRLACYFGLSLGIFLGTKYLGIVYGGLLFIAFCLISKWKRTLVPTSIATILTGSFFYIRNWIDAGNPLFPVEIEILGQKIFTGYLGMNEKISSTSLLENVKDLTTLKEFALHFYYMTGWQSGLIAIASALAIFFLFKKKSKNRKTILLLLLATVAYFFLYYKAPYSYRDLTPNVRYSMMFLLSGTILIGLTFSKHKYLEWALKILCPFVFVLALFKLILFPSHTLIYNDIIALDLEILKDHLDIVLLNLTRLALGSALFYALYKKRLTIALIILALTFTNAYATLSISDTQRPQLKAHFYQKWYKENSNFVNLMKASDWFDQNANEASIAYSGFNFHYQFFGPTLNRKVDYININECSECRYPDYKSEPDSIRRDPNYENWLLNLEAKGKTHLVVDPTLTPGVESFETMWAFEHPEKFKEVFSIGSVHIYEIS